MTNILGDYENQLGELTAEITANIGRLSAVSIENRRDLIIEINRGLDESQEILEQIGLEINQNSDHSQRTSQQMRLKSYQAELRRLEEDYNRSKIKPNPLLLDDSSSIDDFDIGASEDQKRKLLDNSEKLERTGNNLQEGFRICIETEEIGTQILNNLSGQRETIQRSRNRLKETNADLGRSSRLTNMMIMRSIRDKFALYIIGVVFVLAIVLTIYFSIK